MRIAIYILTALLLCACSKKITPSVHQSDKDSVHVSERVSYRDTVVYSPVDSASIMAMVKCPTDGTSVVLSPLVARGNHAKVKVEIVDGMLKADCECDSVKYQLKVAEIERDFFQAKSEKRSEVKVVPERFIPWYMKVLAWIGAGAIVITVIYCFIKIKF